MFDIDDLHDYYNIIKKSILHRQNIVTGLVCHSSDNNDSWVRDNIYVAWALWSLSMAYDNIENDEENISKSRSYELRMKCVKIMRGLLICFMLQVKKVENFTKSHSNIDALHAKYSSTDFKTVVGDNDWGHLQFDAISLYILTLSQMIESNLNVIYDTDEVSFIQNLIFYIECCYRIPDYGIWERGDKNNQGKCELNTISIGMAYAALRSIRNVNLFGKDHSHTTKMYVNEDHMAQCKTILESMMPRESLSKEIGAGLLMIIGFPGFAVQSEEIINLTRERIVSKLNGNYGFKRFIRDGYLTPLEDQNRLHYEKYELHTFENIECEWPLFYACMCINAIFDNEKDSYDLYMHYLEKILLPINTKGSTIHALPECYTVELDMVDQERSNKGSTIRKAAGKFPHIWSQSMYIIGKLLGSGYINKKNLDPLQCYNFKNTSEIPPVVICLVSLHDSIKKMFLDSGIVVETTESLKPVEIYFSTVLGCLLSSIGHNEKLGLTGRQEKNIGILETAKLYTIKNRIFAFYPHFMNISFSYISRDPYYLIDQLRSKILFLRDNWTYKESPIILLSCGMRHVDNKTNNISNQILSATKHFQDGQFDGARIEFGNLNNYLNKVRNCDITHVISNEALQHSISKYEDEFSTNMFVTNTEKNISDIKDSVDISNDILDTPIPTSILSKRRSTVSGIIKQLSLFQSERSQSANSEKLQQNISKCDLLLSISSGDGELDYQNSNNKFCMEKFNDVDIFDLIYQLAGTTILQEQADIVHYLVIKMGLDWKIENSKVEKFNNYIIKDLVKCLHEKACEKKAWWIIRHSAGILNMQMIFLGSAIGNILVRRKDITISRSHLSSDDYVISNPINSHNMALIISELCNDNFGMKMIFQEIIVYIGQLMQSDTCLFDQMIRIRLSLLVNVLILELSFLLNVSELNAKFELMNLSPYELKFLLYNILSVKEFSLQKYNEGDLTDTSKSDDFNSISNKVVYTEKWKWCMGHQYSNLVEIDTLSISDYSSNISISEMVNQKEDTKVKGCIDNRKCKNMWIRRRTYDASLNRIPVGFYDGVWHLLTLCDEIQFESKSLYKEIINEMTPCETQFALMVENVLSCIQKLEYKQLLIETVMMFMSIHKNSSKLLEKEIPRILNIDFFLVKANQFFMNDLIKKLVVDQKNNETEKISNCLDNKDKIDKCLQLDLYNISIYFYNLPPIGIYGSMNYITSAILTELTNEK